VRTELLIGLNLKAKSCLVPPVRETNLSILKVAHTGVKTQSYSLRLIAVEVIAHQCARRASLLSFVTHLVAIES